MKITKTQQGITLVALVITIIVLLVLAVVTIASVTNTGILGYADNAMDAQKLAEQYENQQLSNYLGTLGLYESEEGTGTGSGSGNDIGGEPPVVEPPEETPPREIIKEGTIVKYDSNNDGKREEEWIVLNSTAEKLEIISKNTMGSLTLGKNDPEIKENLDKYLDVDGDGEKDDLYSNGTIGDDFDIAIASYNNAIRTINAYCRSFVTAKDNDGVRSVGGTADKAGYYNFSEFNNQYGTEWNIKVKDTDTNYLNDWSKMETLGIKKSDKAYYFASRYVNNFNSDVRLSVRCVELGGGLSDTYLFAVTSFWAMYHGNPSLAVRPIVINPVNIEY